METEMIFFTKRFLAHGEGFEQKKHSHPFQLFAVPLPARLSYGRTSPALAQSAFLG
jgi:hypothetical protein